nr:hypothetical protein [Planococcus glaciei]
MNKSLFNGTGTLMRFIWRRDRLRIPIWLLSFAVVSMVTAVAFTDLYQNAAERQAIAENDEKSSDDSDGRPWLWAR